MMKTAGFIVSWGLITIATAFAIGTWAFQTWPQPSLVLVYFAVAQVALAIAVGVTWFLGIRSEFVTQGGQPEDMYQRLVGIVGVVMISGLVTISLAAWNIGSVRALFVESRSFLELSRILQDQSPQVRQQACETMFAQGWAIRGASQLVAALDAHPKIAVGCLEAARERSAIGVEEIAQALHDGWSRAAMTAGPQACEIVAWAPNIAQLAEVPAAPAMLQCALGAASSDVRLCCADGLVANGMPVYELIPAQPLDATEALFQPLVDHAFFSGQLDGHGRSIADKLALSTDAGRTWAVQLGCATLNPFAPSGVHAGLVRLVEDDHCDVPVGVQAEYGRPAAIVRLCGQLAMASADQPIHDQVCEAVEVVQQERANEAASAVVSKAIVAHRARRDAAFIEEGTRAYAMRSQEEIDRARDAEFRSQNAAEVLGLPTYQNAPLCPDCKRVDSNTTIGQYLEGSIATEVGTAQALKDLSSGEFVRRHLKRKKR